MVESVSLAFSDLRTGIAQPNLVRVHAIWCVMRADATDGLVARDWVAAVVVWFEAEIGWIGIAVEVLLIR